jgi:putative FmdB family regulatory protein
MPISEWVCKKCGARFELLTLGGAKEEPICEECGSEDVDKLLSRFASTGTGDGGAPSTGGGCAPGRGFT